MRTSALMMQRTSAAITDFHRDEGFESEAYVDDYGGGGGGGGLRQMSGRLGGPWDPCRVS